MTAPVAVEEPRQFGLPGLDALAAEEEAVILAAAFQAIGR